MSQKTIALECPTCKKNIEWTEKFPFKPFCSHRCKLIDLGEWANESHRISGPPCTEDDNDLYDGTQFNEDYFINQNPND